MLVIAALPSWSLGQMQEELPERVDVAELLRAPSMYDGKTVTVRGDLRQGDMQDSDREIFRLRGESTLREIRVGEPRSGMRDLRLLVGQKVLITGIFWDLGSQCSTSPMGGVECFDHRLREFGAVTEDFQREESRYFIGVLSAHPEGDEPLAKDETAEEIEEPSDVDISPGDLVDLRDLVESPGSYAGRRVSVIGKFRGNNLYNDLSIRTKKTPRDFVIKAAGTAIWVTGRRPQGKGFELNPRMRRDTGKWLKVTGVPWMDEGLVYLRAERLEMVEEPEDPSLEPVDVAEEEAKKEEKELGPPPEVAFSLPLDGEQNVPLDVVFRVQFSGDMNESSFNRNVDLLYADDDGTGNPFPELAIRYERADRTLVVDPGRKLEPQKQVQLILYDGIAAEDGQHLVAASDPVDIPGVAVVLTFSTAPQ